MFMTVKETAKQWGISERRVRALCENGKINGAYKDGRSWKIPIGAIKPKDSRYKSAKDIFSEIDRKKHKLDSMRELTEGELARLNQEFAIEYTYNSNAIEGSTLTLRETDLVLRGITIDKKPLREHLEAVGHKEAFDFVSELVKSKTKISVSVIKQIHSLVLADKREDRGIYRSIPVRIVGARHAVAEPYLIATKMESLLQDFLKSEEPLITRLARFHIEFEMIHPFIDGNGRTGRLLVNLELMKAGYPPIDIKYSDRLAYYNAFDEYSEKNSVCAMEKLFAGYVNARLDFYLSVLKE